MTARSRALDFPERIGDGTVALRGLRGDDFGAVGRAFADDPELHVRLGIPRPHTADSMRRETDTEPVARASGRWARFAIAGDGDDALLGALLLNDVSFVHRRCELGVWLAPAARGTGAATRAIALACRLVFGHLGFHRLYLHTETTNRPMRTLAARAGFREEGVLRHHDALPDGTRADLVVAARLATD